MAAAISDAGVNIAAATCVGPGERAELHILVPHAEAARHALAISHVAVTREREVVVVEVEDSPGVLADLTRKIARAGVDLDLVCVATRNRVVFGAPTFLPSAPRSGPRFQDQVERRLRRPPVLKPASAKTSASRASPAWAPSTRPRPPRSRARSTACRRRVVERGRSA